MTRMETRGERLARAHVKHHWITDDPDPTYSHLDTLDGLPRTEGTDMKPHMTDDDYVTPPEPESFVPMWVATILFCLVVVGFVSVVQWIVGAR